MSVSIGAGWKIGAGWTVNTSSPPAAGVWSSGGNMGTARSFLAGAGTSTAGLAFGGASSYGGSGTRLTEEYDGTTWSCKPNDHAQTYHRTTCQ